jgi:hypothetical protein
MSFTVTWTGPTGRERRKAQTAADALRLWTAYQQEAANMVIKDGAGARLTPEALAERARRP